jgi:hypothetical protein
MGPRRPRRPSGPLGSLTWTRCPVGNPDLVIANSSGDVVGLSARGEGETNILVRVMDRDGEPRVHKYRLIVTR